MFPSESSISAANAPCAYLVSDQNNSADFKSLLELCWPVRTRGQKRQKVKALAPAKWFAPSFAPFCPWPVAADLIVVVSLSSLFWTFYFSFSSVNTFFFISILYLLSHRWTPSRTRCVFCVVFFSSVTFIFHALGLVLGIPRIWKVRKKWKRYYLKIHSNSIFSICTVLGVAAAFVASNNSIAKR